MSKPINLHIMGDMLIEQLKGNILSIANRIGTYGNKWSKSIATKVSSTPLYISRVYRPFSTIPRTPPTAK